MFALDVIDIIDGVVQGHHFLLSFLGSFAVELWFFKKLLEQNTINV